MTNQEILTKALRKAFPIEDDAVIVGSFADDLFNINAKLFSKSGALVNAFHVSIFNHNFAKALWGIDILSQYFDESMHNEFLIIGDLYYPYEEGAAISFNIENWAWHLANMVIADDPIKYLGEHLD